MRVLIADKFQAWGVDELKLAGCAVIHEPALHTDSLADVVVRSEANVLIVRSTKVGADVLDHAPALALVIRAGAGTNTIDIEAASRNSILVANCPAKNAVAVAELTFALILALDRRIVENVNDLRQGVWNKKEYSNAAGLKGRMLGIVGMGPIGEAVARRAHAFGMKVAAWSRSLSDERAAELNVRRCGSPAEVASHAHVLSIHLAANADTARLINADVLNRLPRGAFVINTARAEVMDYDALLRAVKERDLRVGLDVFPNEPSSAHGKFTDAVVQAIIETGGIVYGTHHVGASTDQAQNAITEETVRIVRKYIATGRVDNCVNLSENTPARAVLMVRHRNRPGVLAHVLNAVSQAEVNVNEMENVLCSGLESACAKLKLDAVLGPDVVAAIRDGNEHVLGVSQTVIE